MTANPPGQYTVTVRGTTPCNLGEQVAQAHAAAKKVALACQSGQGQKGVPDGEIIRRSITA